jgi:hypothetical protein
MRIVHIACPSFAKSYALISVPCAIVIIDFFQPSPSLWTMWRTGRCVVDATEPAVQVEGCEATHVL